MRKLEGVISEIVKELNYLKRRESIMRDTNGEFYSFYGGERVVDLGAEFVAPWTTESTRGRVARCFFFTFSTLILLGVWQISHLRSFFRKSSLLRFKRWSGDN